MLDGEISHDQVTRFLSKQDYTSKDLWQSLKKEVRSIEDDSGVLIFDDTVQAKPHSKENELICWHYDHTIGQSVKGINLLNCLYHSNGVSIPVAFELIKKYPHVSNVETHRMKRKGDITKNELLRNMLLTCQRNQMTWQYALADSWFSSSENMSFIHKKLHKHFILALKTNRLVALV